jgi:hypothetical protein
MDELAEKNINEDDLLEINKYFVSKFIIKSLHHY